MTDVDHNMRHWAELFSTDPKQTKPFQRAGGFRGTAIKPLWNVMRLTEHFGPMGVGWGTEEPQFKLVETTNEIAVYCIVKCWYKDIDIGGNEKLGFLYGVGGDKVAQQRANSGLFTDDEAFKKAYTDAIANAFVRLGVSADVHLGLFEDVKYLSNVREQYDNSRAIQEQVQQAPQIPQSNDK
jgi:hypothetical protein